ncbi:MAG TPA: hypothetical protein VGO47_09500 [Chlamydiales bacterium]|jgi:hypothetical protein|nr:hypothetical protein [Chlamydiales bacterium]
MTTYINNEPKIDESVLLSCTGAEGDTSPEALNDAISKALANVSDRLDEGHSDPETVRLLGNLKTALVATGKSTTPLLPGVPTPTLTPTSLIPGAGTTPTTLIPTVNLIQNKKDLQEKLFAWIRIYTLNAIYAMPGSMLENSNAIQQYMTDGLNKLSEVVMKDSQEWSDFGQACMTMIQNVITNEANSKDDQNTKSMLIGTYTTSFNLQNTCYQKNLELFSSLNDGVNQTSTSTTQTQTLNNQNITQGPLAMITMLTQCWSVIV